jgi:molybdate-binding protein
MRERTGACRILVGNMKEDLGIDEGLQEAGLGWIDLAQDTYRLFALLNVVMKFGFFQFSSCLHRASTVSKHFFINATDAHNYKITAKLKQ